MSLGDLCALVEGRAPLVIEVRAVLTATANWWRGWQRFLASYSGPVAGMSFDPDQVLALREKMPELARGVVAERSYDEADWPEATPAQRRGMLHLRHAFRTRPHFVAYWVDELPAPAPWIARQHFRPAAFDLDRAHARAARARNAPMPIR